MKWRWADEIKTDNNSVELTLTASGQGAWANWLLMPQA